MQLQITNVWTVFRKLAKNLQNILPAFFSIRFLLGNGTAVREKYEGWKITYKTLDIVNFILKVFVIGGVDFQR